MKAAGSLHAVSMVLGKCPTSPTEPVQCETRSQFGLGDGICPCCDPALKPGVGPQICDEGYICCLDGSWGCSIIGKPGFYGCGESVVTKLSVGIICPRIVLPEPTPSPTKKPVNTKSCCVAEDKPPCKKAACCNDGTWTCPAKDGSYLCPDQAWLGVPTGKVCQKCCIDRERPPCPSGDWSCCSDGTLQCPDPATGLYLLVWKCSSQEAVGQHVLLRSKSQARLFPPWR